MNNKKSNVIWIIADQLRAQAIGCNGDPNSHTPNIDRLAEQGVNFTKAVSGFPLCCPFRGSMLTSKYPHKCVPGHEYQMPTEYKTIAHAFRENDYETAYFGKWHVDGFNESKGRSAFHRVPRERRGGFDCWLGYDNNNSQWDSWVHGHTIDGEEVEHYRLPGYETDCLTDLAIDYIDKKAEEDQPFFAVLSVQPPHDPYVAPEEFMRNYNAGSVKLRNNVPSVDRITEKARRELSGYYAQIENFDRNVGRIIKTLEDADIFYDTHIMIFSDHGDMHGSHGQFRKTTVYEESIRVPFIIGGECSLYDNRSMGNVDVPINHVDIVPTTLGLCGISKPEWAEGTDYSCYRLTNNKKDPDEPDSAFIQSVIATGHRDSCDKPWRAIVTKDGWKYACFEGISWVMFNLNEDPYEQVNLAHNFRYAVKREELKVQLKEWIERTGDNFNLPK